jgi:hypothetical protein
MLGGPGNQDFWEKGNQEPRANWRLTGSWLLVLVSVTWNWIETGSDFLTQNWIFFKEMETVPDSWFHIDT